MNIKESIFNYTRKKQPQREKIFRNYADIRRVLIIFESDWLERHLQVKQLIKELQADGKEVSAWGFIDKKDRTTPILRDFRVVGTRETNVVGQLKKDVLTDFTREHYDVLIDLSVNNMLTLRYMALFADADFKVGKAVTSEPYLHDMMIALPDEQRDAAYLFDQIKHYLQSIQTKN